MHLNMFSAGGEPSDSHRRPVQEPISMRRAAAVLVGAAAGHSDRSVGRSDVPTGGSWIVAVESFTEAFCLHHLHCIALL